MPIFDKEKMKQKPIYPTEQTPSYSDWKLFEMGQELEQKVDEGGGSGGTEYTAGNGIAISEGVISNTKPYEGTDVKLVVKKYTDSGNIVFQVNGNTLTNEEMYNILKDWYLNRICCHIFFAKLPDFGGGSVELDTVMVLDLNDEEVHRYQVQARYASTYTVTFSVYADYTVTLSEENVEIGESYTAGSGISISNGVITNTAQPQNLYVVTDPGSSSQVANGICYIPSYQRKNIITNSNSPLAWNTKPVSLSNHSANKIITTNNAGHMEATVSKDVLNNIIRIVDVTSIDVDDYGSDNYFSGYIEVENDGRYTQYICNICPVSVTNSQIQSVGIDSVLTLTGNGYSVFYCVDGGGGNTPLSSAGIETIRGKLFVKD